MKSFVKQIKSLQYNAALAITGVIRGSSREKYVRNWVWKVLIIENGSVDCVVFIIAEVILSGSHLYNT